MTTTTSEQATPLDEKVKLPRPFILRRLHSLMGLWLVLYLFEHLLVNSQAVFLFEDGGSGFIRMVNHIHDLPYLKAIELILLGIPFVIHGLWGIKYALTAKFNSFRTDGSKPALPQYKRNHAFTWQRLTSWILLIAIVAHVVQMRFLQYPEEVSSEGRRVYVVKLSADRGLQLAAERVGATLSYTESGQVLAAAPSAGAAFLLNVRSTFTSPLMVFLYTILVVAACYHAFNGLWTFMISWGVTLTRRSQKTMRTLTTVLMSLVMILGLMSVWGTFLVTWLNA